MPLAEHPTGWFAVAASRELGVGQVLGRRFMGQELAIFRTPDGRAHALDAYCPHLGAHMGHCGSVVGETLRCDFHGFHFDAGGQCVRTSYGTKAPPKARVGTWPLVEKNGFVFVFHDPERRPPTWDIPTLDEDGWSPMRTGYLRFRGHPQETSENSVDLGHLAVVHGYAGVGVIGEPRTDGPVLRARYHIQRAFGLGRASTRVYVEFDVEVHGLGYSLVDSLMPRFGVRVRQLVLATPAGDGMVDLRLGVTVEKKLGLPTSLFSRFALRTLAHDVRQDLPFWRHKRYVDQPVLAAGDGPIRLYRRWCEQFYPATA